MRAAVAEVEDYVRVDVNSESDDLVAGSAVSDVIHLIAELVENATVFSPPNTRIEVRAERVGTGLVAEVEDRGLGLSAEELADINRRLASAPEFDLARSDQLGLYVVSQLAARHDIKVSLRRSVYGGTTAVVLLPFGVVVREEEAPPIRSDQGEWVSDGARALTGRHRLPAPNRVLDRAPDLAHPDRRVARRPRPTPSGPARRRPRPPRSRRGRSGRRPRCRPRRRPRAGPCLPGPRGTPRRRNPGPCPRTPSRPGRSGGNPRGRKGRAASPAARAPHELERPGAASSDSHLGMPIRVPQASLAPQLRGQRDAARWGSQRPGPGDQPGPAGGPAGGHRGQSTRHLRSRRARRRRPATC